MSPEQQAAACPVHAGRAQPTDILLAVLTGAGIAALVFDHTGWLGAPVMRMSPIRLAGAMLLCGGIVPMRWR